MKKDSITTGLIWGVGTLAISIALIFIILKLFFSSIDQPFRYYGLAFVPYIFLLRYFAKQRKQLTVTKTLIALLFVSFFAYIFIILNNQHILH